MSDGWAGQWGSPQYGQSPYAPQYGQGWPQQGGWPQQQPPRLAGRLPMIIGVLVLIALAAGGGLVVLLSGDKSDDPAAPVRTFLDAAKVLDTAKARGVVCASRRDDLDRNPFEPGDRVTSYRIGAVTRQSETAATVEITVSTVDHPEPDDDNMRVVKENGEWKVCPVVAVPSLPTFSIPNFTFPSLPNFTFPSLPNFTFPSIPRLPSFPFPVPSQS